MGIMKTLLFAMLMGAAVMAQTEQALWDGDMPGTACSEPEEVDKATESGVIRITNVSEPTLTLHLLEEHTEPAPLIIVCPGGGYNILAFDKEGTEIAEWLNSIGVSAAVLKYRVPKNRSGALEDARRAIRLVREKAGEWGIDPERIGMLGFSAGGHLTAACSSSPDRPDFSILVYPAYLYKPGTADLVDEIAVDAGTPPAFVVQTLDDKKFYRSTLAYAAALDAQGIPCEVHLFARGGHGYGLRETGHPVSRWPKLCGQWMRETGFLE
jgi:acetyl esterase/lipase